MDFKQLPKVELHLHLDCSLSYEVVRAIDRTVTVDTYRQQFIAPAKCTNLSDFLQRPPKCIALMQTERNLELVVDDLFEQLRRDNIIYAEIRFAPLQHLKSELQAEQVVEIVENATANAVRNSGIEARLILCTLRHFSEAQSLETVRLVKRFQGTKVAGFDIAADEAGYPIDAHKTAFRFAYDNGIFCTAHAGEARGPASVWETLQHFRPSRIGHGVRSIEDAELLAHLKTNDIHLEVCPTCNVQIDIYDQYRDHPINKLYELGLSVSVNTDARTVTNIDLTREYEKLNRTFGWTHDHFLNCNVHALHAAFIPDRLKSQLIARLQDDYRKIS